MVKGFLDFFQTIDFIEIQNTIQNSGAYDYIFPYLLVYALLVTILPYAKIFQNKQNKPRKSIITVLSLIISFYSISFEISQGQTIGMLMMNLFPNISALTIGIVTLYIIGAILGVDVFKGLFRKDVSAQIYLGLAGIALGMVVYFLGIGYGLWDYDPLDSSSMWNVILALIFAILSIVFIIGGNFVPGILFGVIVISWVFSAQNESILMSFVDPVIFVIVIFAFLLSWINRGDNEKQILAKELEKAKKSVEKFEKENGGKPKEQYSRIYDISHQNYLNKLKKWNQKYGEEDHTQYL